MKRKDLLLLTFLLSQTMPVWAMEPLDPRENHVIPTALATRNPIDKVQALQQSLLDIQRAIKANPAAHLQGERVFLIGITGSGKSTLINFLVGIPLFANEEGQLDAPHPLKGSEIGHDETSKTTLPSLCQGPNNMILCDLAGFGDSRGPEQELINRAHQLFSGPCKFLVAVSETSLADRVGEFLRLMDDLTRTIPVHQLKESLALVVTKQGTVKYSKPHQKLQKIIIGAEGSHALTDDVKQLLLHLTEGDNIHVRIPFFPCPNTIGCEYDSQESREKILESINHLKPILNPDVKMQLPPESMVYIMDLADNLNKEVENSLDMLRQKVVHLCKMQTNAYAHDGHMQGLEINLGAIKKSLNLLVNASAESMLDFTHPLDTFFDQDNNVKEYVKTLIFLKTLKDNISYSNEAWAHTLQLTLADMHELIDSLTNKLFQKITTSLETINESIRCKALPEPNNEEGSIEKLQHTLGVINTVVANLQADSSENIIHFANPLNEFLSPSNRNAIENHMGTLAFLKTLKKIDYPIGDWIGPCNPSITHLQQIIRSQQNSIVLKEQNGRLEEERRRDKEAARVAAEGAERQRLADLEAQRQAQALLQQQLAQQQAQAEADRQERLRQQAEFEAYQRQIAMATEAEAERRRQEAAAAKAERVEAAQKLAAVTKELAAQQAAAAEAIRVEAARVEAAQQAEYQRLNTPISRAAYRRLPADKRRIVTATIPIKKGKTKVVREYYPL